MVIYRTETVRRAWIHRWLLRKPQDHVSNVIVFGAQRDVELSRAPLPSRLHRSIGPRRI